MYETHIQKNKSVGYAYSVIWIHKTVKILYQSEDGIDKYRPTH